MSEFFRDSRTVIEVHSMQAMILPVPLHDPARTRELHALFPSADGWLHFACSVAFNSRILAKVLSRAAVAKAFLEREALGAL